VKNIILAAPYTHLCCKSNDTWLVRIITAIIRVMFVAYNAGS